MTQTATTSQVISPAKKKITIFSSENRSKVTWILFLLPALAIYLTFMAGPLFDSLRLSLYQGEGYNPTKFVGLAYYVDLFTNLLWRDHFFGAVLHTFIFFSIHMIVQNSLGLLFANLLASEFTGRNLFRTIIFTPATLSVLVTG